jgi:CHAD domain-containing protein
VDQLRPVSDTAGGTDDGPSEERARSQWRKARATVIRPRATAEDALARIVHDGVEHLRANEACVLARAHDEGIHQMRVAVRRLRSSLSLYQDMLPADQRAYLGAELRWLIGELGPARDWDVFLAETLPPVLVQFPDEKRLIELKQRAEAERDAGYERAQAALDSHRYTGLVMLLGAWADGRRWNDQVDRAPPEELRRPAVEVASRLIDEHYRAVLTAGEHFADLGAEDRHRLRIRIKKLRYAAEFFGSLYRKRRVTPYLEVLKTLQDRLGSENDVAVARRLLLRTSKARRGKERGRLSYAAGLVVGWHGHVADGREERLRVIWDRFIARPPFWDRPAPADEPAEQPPVETTVPASAEAEAAEAET